MLLTVDIGNTSIHNGIFKGRTLKKIFRVSTYARDPRKEYINKLRPYLHEIDCIIIVSVAPKVLKEIVALLKKILDRKIFIVGKDLDAGVKNLYRHPSQVGQDRLVNARAAYDLYGGESIIVDFGTAITIDIINRKKEYLGGVIAPGVEISLKALSEQAALLPKITLKKPHSILGKETLESMRNGAVYGFSSLCDGIVIMLKKRYCKNSRVIATGGMSPLITSYCKTIDKIDTELTLKGLRLIGEGCCV
jgi:type III pantothenate kinase